MIWDVPHHRGAGFPLSILRPTGVYSILSSLYQDMHLRPVDLMRLLALANIREAPLMGVRDLSAGIGGTLGDLADAGLLVQCVGGHHGGHTRYDLTRFGARLVAALAPVSQWAMSDFAFVASATRARLGLPPLIGRAPAGLRTERTATGMAIGLMDGLWSTTVMVYVDSAGCDGIGALRLEDTVNAAIDASSGESRVERHLHRGTLYRTLHGLVAKGLLTRVEDPPRVRYLVTPHGRGMMDAWWQVADGFGIKYDDELFRIVQATTSWFKPPSEG